MNHHDVILAMRNPLVIYHANCMDGFGAAWAAHCTFGDEAEYLPAAHGQANEVEPLSARARWRWSRGCRRRSGARVGLGARANDRHHTPTRHHRRDQMSVVCACCYRELSNVRVHGLDGRVYCSPGCSELSR
jgi:hypothetical protein